MKIMLMAPPLHSKLESFKMEATPPLGIYVLGSVLRNNGYRDLTFCDAVSLESCYRDGWDIKKIKHLVEGYDIIGISSNSFNWGTSRELIEIIKQGENAPFVVCGGVHPGNFDEHVLRVSKADAVVRGDGEEPILKLLQCIENNKPYHDVPGLSYRKGTQITRNPVKIDTQLTDTFISVYDEMLQNLYLGIPLETSRGCRYNCSFCAVPHQKNWRGLDVDVVTGKIRHALNYLDKVKLNNIHFIDDYFCGHLERSMAIFEWIDRCSIDFKVNFEARVNDFLHPANLLRVLPPDRISELHMGIECGYDEGLKKIGKGFRIDDVGKCLGKLEDHELTGKVSLSFILGFPWEGLSDCLKTIDFGKQVQDRYQIGNITYLWWIPVISRLWESRASYGITFDETIFDDADFLTEETFLYQSHPGLKRRDIEIIDIHTIFPISDLLGKKNEMRGFEI
jgi:radical SAM superfamily enzyme YgiQ (UPF0313 family)